jgi:S-adenosylmethionine synthetase
MPAPIQYAHAILRRLAEVRKSGAGADAGPGCQVAASLRYEDGKPVEVTSIVLSTQHTSKRQTSKVIRAIVEPYIRESCPRAG